MQIKKFGHTIEECRNKKKADEKEGKPEAKATEEKKDVLKCYGCGNPGYIRSKCPKCQGDQIGTNTIEFCKITQRSRPIFNIKVGDANGIAFADSGAQVSVAGHSLYQILEKEDYPFSDEVVRVAYADGIQRPENALRAEVDVEL